MKKSDIAMVVLIASVSVMISFVIANQISFLKPPQKGEDVKTIEKINPDVPEPDTKVFRADAINPTVQTVIGGGQSEQ
jgi:hypothetical protein